MKNKKYYAIKIGNNVKDIIVEEWEECKKYTQGYPAIYKSFKNKREAKRYLENFSNEEIQYYLIKYEMQRFLRLKEKIEMKYHFEIPDYIIDEMINGKHINNLICLINIAVMNNRISKKDAEILKKREYNKYILKSKS